jgi:hypothetical protein
MLIEEFKEVLQALVRVNCQKKIMDQSLLKNLINSTIYGFLSYKMYWKI